MAETTPMPPGIPIREFHFDKQLLASVKAASVPMSRVYPFDHEAVVAGRGSDLAREIHLPKVREDRIPVYRRMGGGCTVFLDPGNLVISIAFPASGFGGIQTLFNLSSDWLIRGFRDMGLSGVYQDGISDLVMENKKIGGSCFYRTKGFAYYSAAILVTPDLEKMGAYLQHPPREPEYRNGRSHEDFVAGLNCFLPHLTVDSLARSLSACLDPASMAA
jgi:lipoate-protein ligase A